MKCYRKNMKTFSMRMFPVNERVETLKGRRTSEPFSGAVVKHSFWKEYPIVMVRKDSGKIVNCFMHNLQVVNKEPRIRLR